MSPYGSWFSESDMMKVGEDCDVLRRWEQLNSAFYASMAELS